jgi:predicted metalloprotease with PDZ domain
MLIRTAAAALGIALAVTIHLADAASDATPSGARAAIPVAKDAAYPGTCALEVDLRDVGQKIFRVRESIPVQPGPLVLFYPKWIPGEHGPTGTLDTLAGIRISSGGKPIAWRRDLKEMYALHLNVPAGTERLDVEFQVLSPTAGGAFGASVSVTERLADLEWNQVLFYPAGHYARNFIFQPSVRLPNGWKFASALRSDEPEGPIVRFNAVDLETLVDSPLIAGKNFRRIPVSGAGVPAVHLNIVADRPEDLAATTLQIEHQKALVGETYALFGARHYQHYDFLLTLSDSTGHFGLEHHQSSDDRLFANYFTDSDSYLAAAYLMPHEYVHSWNGKFRRPADLATVNYDEPMLTDLLWVYEGLTNYLGEVLASRSGFWTAGQYREYLAERASSMNHTPGRSWQALQDTADEAQVLYNLPDAWASWRRGVDFYDEGSLLWLDVDTKIRELSHDRKSLDDFTHLFHGMQDGATAVVGYDINDVVATLNRVQPFDWATFLHSILNSTTESAPLDGITRGGWKLSYSDQPNEMLRAREKERKYTDLTDSIGLRVDEDEKPGTLIDVLWQGPAFNAGAAPGMRLIAVNGDKYSAEVLRDAVAAARDDKRTIDLLVQNQDIYLTIKVDYHAGPRYPHLERVDGTPDRIAEIVRAHG